MANAMLKEEEARRPLSLTGLDDALPPNPYQLEARRLYLPYEIYSSSYFEAPDPRDCDEIVYVPPSYKKLEHPIVFGPSYNPTSYKKLESQTVLPSAPSYEPTSCNPTSYKKLESEPILPSAPTYEPTSYKKFEFQTFVPMEALYVPTSVMTQPYDYHYRPRLTSSLVPQKHGEIFCKVGVHCYNLLNRTNLEFWALDKHYLTGLIYKRIKLSAKDPSGTREELITRVVRSESEEEGCWSFITSQCHLMSADANYDPCDDFDKLAVDDFFKGDMPNSMPAPEDTSANLQYYELNESEVEENMEWLIMYVNLAFYNTIRYFRHSAGRGGQYDLRKVIVQTREDVESKKKAKEENAIFYITIKIIGYEDADVIIRRTTDGIPEHMSLQVKCLD